MAVGSRRTGAAVARLRTDGVTSLFAALDVASGVAISGCYRRHRHREFLRFTTLIFVTVLLMGLALLAVHRLSSSGVKGHFAPEPGPLFHFHRLP